MTPTGGNLHDAVFASAKLSPERTALIADGRPTSYGELAETALQWASALRYHLGDRTANVGILSQRNKFACIAILSVLAAGMTYVPLNVNYPEAALSDVFSVAGLDAMIVGSESFALASLLAAGQPRYRIFALEGDWRELEKAGTIVHRLDKAPQSYREPRIVNPDEPAYLLFTSGSTGRPKGVAITHRAIVDFLTHSQSVYQIAPDDKLTQLFDHSFDLSLFDMFMAWRHGACTVLLDRSSPKLLSEVARHDISIWFSVPSVAARLLASGMLVANALPVLRYSLFCGEALYGEVARAWRKSAPNSVLENLYGPTELTVACTRHRIDPADISDGIVPIGTVFPHLEWAICEENGHASSAGEVGELCVGGSQMFEGYWRCPSASPGVFHQASNGIRLYRTGDLVRMRDSKLDYVGRRDTQIKLNGFRIELSQIELGLRRAGAQDAVAMEWPPGGRPIAIWAAVTGPKPIDDILRDLANLLPSHMLPAQLIKLSRMPLTLNGKIDRSTVRDCLQSGTRDLADVDSIIAEVLHLSAGEITDDVAVFSTPSWDSLAHAKLMLALEDRLNIPFNANLVNQIRSIGDVRALANRDRKGEQNSPSRVGSLQKGLAGVLMDRTAICKIDGLRGELSYRGYSIEELCDRSSYEDVAHLLVDGALPDDRQLRRVRLAFTEAQTIDRGLERLIEQTIGLHPTKALAMVAASSTIESPFHMIGHLAAATGAFCSKTAGASFEPLLDLDHHERVFRYVVMRSPTQLESDFVRQDLILHAEHGANASTLALRTAISSGADLSQAIAAAILTFAGPIHGGAVEGAAATFDAVGSPQRAQQFVGTEGRIMGFGHRVYRTEDPRAARLKHLVEGLAAEKGNLRELNIAKSLVQAVERRSGKGVAVNVDLFAAVGYRLLGIDDTLGAVMAILGRIAGWCAHALEQRQNNVLIRPDFLYDGPPPRSVPKKA